MLFIDCLNFLPRDHSPRGRQTRLARNYRDCRIISRNNVFINGEPATQFTCLERCGNVFIYGGKGSAPGHDASEKQCAEAWLES